MVDLSNPIIWIVHPDDDVRTNLKHYLEKGDFKVQETGEKPEMSMIGDFLPELIILDMDIFDPDAFHFCREIKSTPDTASISVIFTTTRELNNELKLAVIGCGAEGYLNLPVDSDIFLSYIRALFNSRKAHREFAETTREWEATFDSIRDPLFISRPDGRIVRCNKALTRFVGKTRQEIYNRYCYDLIHPELVPHPHCPMTIAKESGKRESELLQLKGRFMEVTVDPMFDEDGKLTKFIHITKDLTEFKIADEALMESEENFRNVIQKSADAIILVDPEGIIHFANPATENLFGKPADSMTGSPFDYPLVLDQTLEIEIFVDENILRTAEMYVSETVWKQKTLYLVQLRNITSRKILENQLKKEVEINAAIARLSSALLSPMSFSEISITVLKIANRLTGSPFGFVGYIDESTGSLIVPTFSEKIWERCSLKDCNPDEDMAFHEYKGLWGWVLENRKPLMTNDPANNTRSTGVPDGHLPISRFLSCPALVNEKLVGQIAVANSDKEYDHVDFQVIERLAQLYALAIQRRRTEIELETAKKTAEEATISKNEFLANMTHEIRTPINSMLGMVELSLDRAKDDDQKDFLNMAKTSAEMLLELVNNIFDFSKMESGKINLNMQDIELRPFLEKIIRDVSGKINDKPIEAILDIRPEAPAVVHVDPDRLKQVCTNLLDNSVKFTEKGEIGIVVRTDPDEPDNRLRFEVYDTGIGIAEERIDRIFTGFCQDDSSLTRRFGGVGLGVFLSKRLVEMMGGSIWVQSQCGKGSVFSFTLPYEKKDETKIGRQEKSDALKSLYGLLIVENESLKRIVGQWLAQNGAIPVVIPVGKKGRPVSGDLDPEKTPPSFIVVDAGPDNSEIKTAENLALQYCLSHIPHIFLKKDNRDLSVNESLEKVYIVQKPVMYTEFMEKVIFSQTSGESELVLQDEKPDKDSGRSLNILLAEDILFNRKLVRALLNIKNYRVKEVENGIKAVEACKEEDFDLILMDIQMPEMDGIEATRQIREMETEKHTPVIALTAYASRDDREKCFAAGMDDFIPKPIRKENFYHVIEKVLSGRDCVQQSFKENEQILAESPLNMEKLMEIVGEDESLLGELVSHYLENIPYLMDQIQKSIESQNHEELKFYAHSLKGMSLNLSAESVAKAALKLEQMGSDHNREFTEADTAYQTLEQEIERLKKAAVLLQQ